MIHITIGSGKMEGINSINVSSLENPYCIAMSKNKDLVCSKCYSNRYSKLRPSLENVLIRNTELLTKNDLTFEDIPVINALYFRFNSFGELYNEQYLYNLILICEKNPDTMFALWTKRRKMVIRFNRCNLPNNLILVYSEPIINDVNWVLEFPFDKQFTVVDKTYIGDKNCSKQCLNCLKCYKKNEIIFIIELIK